METKLAIEMQRFSVTSSKPFEEVLAAVDMAFLPGWSSLR